VALLLLLPLLGDPAAAVTVALRFRRCVGLPSSEQEDRSSIDLLLP
jgi:hypothetical protein